MMRQTWAAVVAGLVLAACGGSVSGFSRGSGGGAGSSGTGGYGGTGGDAATGGTGGYGTGGYATGGYATGGYGGYGTGGSGTGGSGAGGSGGYGGACCTSDAQCVPGEECTSGGCLPIINGCWRNADCGPGAHCVGASICPCGAYCAGPNLAGTCQPDSSVCCTSDADCTGEECVNGKCKPPPPLGECWRNSDCQFYSCYGAYVCQCGTALGCMQLDHPGSCGVADDGGLPP